MTYAIRKKLPDRRAWQNFCFVHAGHKYTATFSRDNAGNIAEVFLNASKSGSATDAYANDGALLFSISLQHGVPLAAFAHAVKRDADGRPSSPIGAALDLLAPEASA
jgi:hypothetical protein